MPDDPDLRFFGFSLWITGRQFPKASDFWDGNSLMIRARMEATGACVDCSGPILRTTDIAEFRADLAKIYEAIDGEAALTPLEPNLKVIFRMDNFGQVEGTVEITPDQLTQRHIFTLHADQSYLPALIASCDAILDRFPIRNADTNG